MPPQYGSCDSRPSYPKHVFVAPLEDTSSNFLEFILASSSYGDYENFCLAVRQKLLLGDKGRLIFVSARTNMRVSSPDEMSSEDRLSVSCVEYS
jgi:hypothetical protein